MLSADDACIVKLQRAIDGLASRLPPEGAPRIARRQHWYGLELPRVDTPEHWDTWFGRLHARIPADLRNRFPWAKPKATIEAESVDHLLIADVLRGNLPPRIKKIGAGHCLASVASRARRGDVDRLLRQARSEIDGEESNVGTENYNAKGRTK
jgi:hypothetical protein